MTSAENASSSTANGPSSETWINSGVALVLACGAAVGTGIALSLVDADTATTAVAVLIAMIFGAYAGFAIANGSTSQTVVEFAFIAAGLGTVAAAFIHSRLWLAVAPAPHGVWDMLHGSHRRVVGTRGVPAWYLRFCATYDFLAAAAFVLVVG